ncbi:MAG TPA: hypothetical protein VID30_05730 [Bradyrhizobium sp.]|jgi:hypothetical protein
MMSLDPEEFVILADHGSMKLQSAVARAMILPPEERDHASILREGEPWMLNFAVIKHLAARWEPSPYRLSESELRAGAFLLGQPSL